MDTLMDPVTRRRIDFLTGFVTAVAGVAIFLCARVIYQELTRPGYYTRPLIELW